MSKIQDLSNLDKPREKAERFGIENLKDEELLALIINVGTVGHSSLEIAKDLLNDAKELSLLFSKPYQYFKTFKGLKTVNALKLAAVSEISKRMNQRRHLIHEEKSEINSESLYQRYALSLNDQTQENLVLVILNKNKQIVYETTLYKGNDNALIISSREIIRIILLHNGYYFYLIHNHPNDTFYPSKADIAFTKNINNKAKKVGVKLLDHIIISDKGYYSFLWNNLIESDS